MLTLGIDLSADPALTASFMLDWRDGPGRDRGAVPMLGLNDDAVLESMPAADKVGIDAPFGWPDAFRLAVNDWSEQGKWPDDVGPQVLRKRLRYRLTDDFQRSRGRTPLSVSSDRIASTAMRCADLLAQHYAARGEPLDRVNGHVVEVYPAAALVAWGVDVRGYKDPSASAQREQMARQLAEQAGLVLKERTIELCAETDHALDALVSCLVARAQALGLTHPAPAEHAEQVAREGWIHLPSGGSLQQLAGAGS